MFNSVFRGRVKPLTHQQIAMLRILARMPTFVPAPPYTGASPPTTEQAHLWLSLNYAAGVRVTELSQMRLDALLDDDGTPKSHVHIRPETTKHFVSRRIAMAPDIRRDLLAFNKKHPGEKYVAFVPLPEGNRRPEPMSANGLSVWFQQFFRNAGLRGLTVHSGRKFFNDNQRSDNDA